MAEHISSAEAEGMLAEVSSISDKSVTQPQTWAIWIITAAFGIAVGLTVWGTSWSLLFLLFWLLLFALLYKQLQARPARIAIRQDPKLGENARVTWQAFLPMIFLLPLNLLPNESLPWAVGAGLAFTLAGGFALQKGVIKL
ncbi:hypothetical protein QP027_08830 [Corynebacterium breve]|uniref:DUF2178 domain-containing protein n=1 Tax=Corynebacterium breve TaxID=3049799 RepID=A0ABY8VG77_9CORY|nr:hypothetical protein [Corynebacterium breve]WIM67219.1 hypothetical protein QP027_08830 [Corynebacterium breve]